MSAILRDDASIRDIASTACATTSPLRLATALVFKATWSACCAFSEFFFDGGGNLLHRSGGLFETRGLLLGPLRQVGSGTRDFARGAGNLVGGRTNHRNRLRQALGRRVGVVLQIRKGALVAGDNARRQVALRQRTEHVLDVIEDLADIAAHRIQRLGQVADDAFLAFQRHALGKIAGHRRLNDPADRGVEIVHDLGHDGFAFDRGDAVKLHLASASSRAFSADLILKVSTAAAISPISSLRPSPGKTTSKSPSASFPEYGINLLRDAIWRLTPRYPHLGCVRHRNERSEPAQHRTGSRRYSAFGLSPIDVHRRCLCPANIHRRRFDIRSRGTCAEGSCCCQRLRTTTGWSRTF